MRIARLAALLVVASCRNVLDAGSMSPAGTYTLVQLDGTSLPARIATGFTVRGSVELKTNSHYAVTQTDSASGAPSNTSATGVWSVTDNALQLVPDGGGLLLGIVYSDTVRLDFHGHANLYVRH